MAKTEGADSGPRFSIFAAAAVFDPELEPIDVRVLAALGTHTDKHGWCHPSQRRLTTRLRANRTRIITALKTLEKLGYIESESRTRPNGSNASKLYRVFIDAGPHLRTGADSTEGPGADSTEGPGADSTEGPPERTQENDPKRTRRAPGEVDSLFETFWAEYPHSNVRSRRRKADARRAFQNLSRSIDDLLIVVYGAQAYAESDEITKPKVDAQGRDFIPSAAVWLNQRRFEDWLEEPAGKGKTFTLAQWESAIELGAEWAGFEPYAAAIRAGDAPMWVYDKHPDVTAAAAGGA